MINYKRAQAINFQTFEESYNKEDGIRAKVNRFRILLLSFLPDRKNPDKQFCSCCRKTSEQLGSS